MFRGPIEDSGDLLPSGKRKATRGRGLSADPRFNKAHERLPLVAVSVVPLQQAAAKRKKIEEEWPHDRQPDYQDLEVSESGEAGGLGEGGSKTEGGEEERPLEVDECVDLVDESESCTPTEKEESPAPGTKNMEKKKTEDALDSEEEGNGAKGSHKVQPA